MGGGGGYFGGAGAGDGWLGLFFLMSFLFLLVSVMALLLFGGWVGCLFLSSPSFLQQFYFQTWV